MKIYVVAHWHDYEGYEEPQAAFLYRVSAQDYIKLQNPHDEFTITELLIDTRMTDEQIKEACLSG